MKITAIIVDDEVLAIERLESVLVITPEIKMLGKYLSAKEAQKEILNQNPDIVFSDYEMPEMSGLELFKEIKRLGGKSKFVFITGYDHYAIKALREQAFDYLIKPIDFDDIKQMIARYNNLETNKTDLVKSMREKFSLTSREAEVLSLILQGKSSKDISQRLFISKLTVDTHRKNLLEKIKVKSVKELLFTFVS